MFESLKASRRARALMPIVGLMGAVVGMAACDSGSSDILFPPVVGAVATFKDTTFDFTTLHTFAMPDTVVHLVPVTGTPLDVSRDFDRAVLDQVRNDLIGRGYVQVTDPQTVTPDFVVLVGATATTNYNAFVSYPWFTTWGFYSGFNSFNPGFNASWGIVYPWFPVVGVTAFDRGTLLVDLIPTKSVNPLAETITSAWTGAATAALNGAITQDVITASIDRMFQLSPYLTAPAVNPLTSRGSK